MKLRMASTRATQKAKPPKPSNNLNVAQGGGRKGTIQGRTVKAQGIGTAATSIPKSVYPAYIKNAAQRNAYDARVKANYSTGGVFAKRGSPVKKRLTGGVRPKGIPTGAGAFDIRKLMG